MKIFWILFFCMIAGGFGKVFFAYKAGEEVFISLWRTIGFLSVCTIIALAGTVLAKILE